MQDLLPRNINLNAAFSSQETRRWETYISQGQLEAVVDLVRGLDSLTALEQFPEFVVPALASLLRCDIATYNEIGPTGGTFLDFPPGSLGIDNSGTFENVPSPAPVDCQLGITVSTQAATVVWIALHRSNEGFTETERDLCWVLQRPLAQSYTGLLRASNLRRQRLGTPCPSLDLLTTAELAVLRRAASGATNVAIARQLGCSPRTVAKHLEHIYRKLDVVDRSSAAARYATVSGAWGNESA